MRQLPPSFVANSVIWKIDLVSSQIGRIPELDEEKPPNDYRHF